LDAIERTLARSGPSASRTTRRCRLGAENMWDDVFYSRVVADAIPHYRDTSRSSSEIPPRLMRRNDRASCSSSAWPARYPVHRTSRALSRAVDNDALAKELRRHCAFVLDLAPSAAFMAGAEMKQARAPARHRAPRPGRDRRASTSATCQQAARASKWIEKKLRAREVTRLFDSRAACLARRRAARSGMRRA